MVKAGEVVRVMRDNGFEVIHDRVNTSEYRFRVVGVHRKVGQSLDISAPNARNRQSGRSTSKPMRRVNERHVRIVILTADGRRVPGFDNQIVTRGCEVEKIITKMVSGVYLN